MPGIAIGGGMQSRFAICQAGVARHQIEGRHFSVIERA
jgi:hypothetical protein